MPRNDGSASFRPQYVPALQFNADGVMVNNSAQTQMHVGMQKLLLEKGSRPPRANENLHMARRQALVDDFLKARGGQAEKISTKNWAFEMPKIASPQPIYSGLYDAKGKLKSREQQMKAFEGSFLDRSKSTYKMIHEEIDDAMRQADERKKSLSVVQKMKMSETQKSDFFYQPLKEAIKYLNDEFAVQNDPIRVKWREVQLAPDHTRVDLFMLFPNSLKQYEGGFEKWLGAEDVVA